jgi:hypothetical protein
MIETPELLELLKTPRIEIEKALFMRGDFSFIVETEKGRNTKQEQALIELTQGVSREILYGGAAGGAKSWTGATWLTMMCECCPGTRWFAGRDSLTDLENSTKETFNKVFKAYGVEGVVYNGKYHFYKFANGSRIDLVDLGYYPTDDQYERLGSYEWTGGWIEEGGEINSGAYDTLKTRIGRHMNDLYGIRPILYITCNPKKNWMYYEFYDPWKRGELESHKVFIQAFAEDNPARESGYIGQLESLKDQSKRERLLLGNWDYDDDPAILCEFDAIVDMFTNDHVLPTNEKGISSDLAMKGRDRFIIGNWHGLVCNVYLDKVQANGKEIEEDLKKAMVANAVPRSRTVVDSDGLGNYLESYLVGIKEFRGGATAKDKKEFANLKAECGYYLASLVNQRKIKVICSQEQKKRIIEEMGVLKSLNVDKDETRKRIIPKDEMKKILRRSPDYLDMLLMGMYLQIFKEAKGSRAG